MVNESIHKVVQLGLLRLNNLSFVVYVYHEQLEVFGVFVYDHLSEQFLRKDLLLDCWEGARIYRLLDLC